MGGDIDLVTGKPVKNKERELLVALTPEEKRAQKEARAAEMAAKRAAKKKAKGGGGGDAAAAAAEADADAADAESAADAIARLTTTESAGASAVLSSQLLLAKQRSVTGVLASDAKSAMNVRVEKFSLAVAGATLLDDATLDLNVGTRLGFIGQNGSGKTNVLNAIALRELPIPDHFDLYHLHQVRSIQKLFTHRSVSTFDRSPFQLTGELFLYGMALRRRSPPSAPPCRRWWITSPRRSRVWSARRT